MTPADYGLIVLLGLFVLFEVKTSGGKKQTQKIVQESKTIPRRI